MDTGLGFPQHLRVALGVSGETASPEAHANGLVVGVPADTYDLQRLAEAIGRSGNNLKRRDVLSLAAQLGAAAALARSEVLERLASALTSSDTGAVNEAVVREMEARSAGFHRLEEIVSAPTLLKGLIVQLQEVTTLLNSTSADPKNNLRVRLTSVAGENSVLAGWLASDIGDSVAARNFYDTAMTAAKEADDPAIAACSLAYKSYIPSTRGANGRSRVLLAQALEIAPSQLSPATLAWIAARHAEESAAVGDRADALNSWGRAEEAYSVADPEDDRVWTRFLDRNRFDSYRISMYAKVGKMDEAQEAAKSILERLDQPDRKKAAIIFEDIASAHLARGAVNDASTMGKSGLAVLRETGFGMWLPRYEALAKRLDRWQRQTPVKAFLEEFARVHSGVGCDLRI
jgi:tetratricopeptide (TPR) repeat protein